jgi:hypothetical protein
MEDLIHSKEQYHNLEKLVGNVLLDDHFISPIDRIKREQTSRSSSAPPVEQNRLNSFTGLESYIPQRWDQFDHTVNSIYAVNGDENQFDHQVNPHSYMNYSLGMNDYSDINYQERIKIILALLQVFQGFQNILNLIIHFMKIIYLQR